MVEVLPPHASQVGIPPRHRRPGHPLFRRLLPVLCGWLAAALADAAQTPEIPRTPAPAWVDLAAVDLSSPTPEGGSTDGAYSLLSEMQVNAAEQTAFHHEATRVLSSTGVQESGKVSVSFDPSYEAVALHRLVVYREGKAIDRLPQQQVQMLQRENGMERHLYDGRLTALMLLDDIRPGDTIEYAYSVKGANPIFEGRFTHAFPLRASEPLHRRRYRLLWPADRPLAYKGFNESAEPRIEKQGALAVYTWERNDAPAVIADDNLPSWFSPCGWIQLTEFQNWRDVAQWAARLYVVSGELPEDLGREIETIAARPDKKAQAAAALRLIQNNVRYLGMENGVHGYKPHPAETVWNRRFGDCKDKALLLCAVLRRLGMEADPALVETDYRRTIADMLPSPTVFDHLVVRLRLDDRDYWLDPTMSHQGGRLDEIFFPDYGKALVVRDDSAALSDILPGGREAAGVEASSDFAPGEKTGEMTLKVRTVYRGQDADRMREWLAETSRAEAEKALLNRYAKLYPEVHALTPPKIADDLEKNELVAEESYRIGNFWRDEGSNRKWVYGEFNTSKLGRRLPKPVSHARTMPLPVDYPCRVTERIHIAFRKAARLTEHKLEVKDPAFTFSYARTRDTDGLTLQLRYETLADAVEADRAGDYLTKVERVSQNTGYDISFPQYELGDLYTAAAAVVDSPVVYPRSAGVPRSVARGFLLAPFLVAGGIGAVLVARKRRSAIAPPAPDLEPLHSCRICGCTEHTAPHAEFRVSADGHEYCRPHLPREGVEG